MPRSFITVGEAASGAAAANEAAGFLPVWQAADVPLLLLLPALLVCSAFFSGSETALFSMSEAEQMHLRRRGGFAARAVESLLSNQRMLLITILLGNMTVNVLYFIISSVLVMRAAPEGHAGIAGAAILAAITLLAIVLGGEILPKMLANIRRSTFASIAAPPLLAIHNLITPLRAGLDRLVVAPLSRLTAPQAAPPGLDAEELQALLEISSRQGDIGVQEQRLLRDVVNLSRLRVRDVMTPRVRLQAVPADATHEQVSATVRETRLTRLPVYRRSLDEVVGVLLVKQYLLQAKDPASARRAFRRSLRRPRFVPHLASLDQLLEQFRRTHTNAAIVVDEFGGTAGIVSIEDIVDRLAGDVAGGESREGRPPRPLGPGQWELDGDISVHDWAEAFGQQIASPRVATLGGLIIEHLGRAPEAGDVVRIGNVRLEVTEIDRARVVTAVLSLSD